MKILKHIMKSAIAEQITTEIRFVVASARASGYELLSLYLENKDDNENKISTALLKCLRAMKKEGRIDFFASKEAFLDGRTEASYLINKFPEITEFIDREEIFLIIRI